MLSSGPDDLLGHLVSRPFPLPQTHGAEALLRSVWLPPKTGFVRALTGGGRGRLAGGRGSPCCPWWWSPWVAGGRRRSGWFGGWPGPLPGTQGRTRRTSLGSSGGVWRAYSVTNRRFWEIVFQPSLAWPLMASPKWNLTFKWSWLKPVLPHYNFTTMYGAQWINIPKNWLGPPACFCQTSIVFLRFKSRVFKTKDALAECFHHQPNANGFQTQPIDTIIISGGAET